MVQLKVKGCICPVVTPFASDGGIDEKTLRSILDYLMDGGVHAIFAAGTVGAFYLMSPDERKRVAEIVIDHLNGRVPVYVGTGGITVRENVELAKHAKDIGADAAVVLTPYYVKVNDEELHKYFTAIAGAVDMPIILYNNPGRAGVNISPSLLEKVVSETTNVVAIKDSGGDLTQFEEYLMQIGNKISVVMGKDELMLAALTVGGSGVVSAVSNVAPELVTGLYNSFVKGDVKKALDIQYKLIIIKKAIAGGTYPAPILEALNFIGIKTGKPRPPVLPLNDEQKERIRKALKAIGKLPSK
nr:4-hydroxy-tetrahydrodipicolinate synthase [Candidatus Njordarchaeum guaymaensis]